MHVEWAGALIGVRVVRLPVRLGKVIIAPSGAGTTPLLHHFSRSSPMAAGSGSRSA